MRSQVRMALVVAFILAAVAFVSGCAVGEGPLGSSHTSTTQPSGPSDTGFIMPQ